MKWAIRALSLAIYVLWLIVIVFTVTAVYSATQLGIDFSGEPQTSTSGGTMTLSVPFSINNRGFYDITDLNITTIIQESEGTLVSNSSTIVPLISSGSKVDATHNISISLNNMTSASLSRLLFNDTNFNVNMSLALNYARVIPLKISTSFQNFAWGAPLYNLSIGDVTVNSIPGNFTHVRAILPISFENHSFFTLNGTVRTEIVNTLNQKVGDSTTQINVPPKSGGSIPLTVFVSTSYGSLKEARLYFEFPSVFSYGPVVIPIPGVIP
jgi:hypothetical protein